MGDDVVEWQIDEDLLGSQIVRGFSEIGDDFGKLDRLVVDFVGHGLAALCGTQLPQRSFPHMGPSVLLLLMRKSVENCDEASGECVGPVVDASFPDGPSHVPRPLSTRHQGGGIGLNTGPDWHLDLAADDAKQDIVGSR